MTDIEIRTLATQPTAAVRVRTTMDQIAAQFDRYLPAVMDRLQRDGDTPIGPPYARYHEFGDAGVDVEIGFPLGAPAARLPALAGADPGDVGNSELPGGEVAVAIHRGPYEGLAGTYDALGAWLREHDREAASAPWESYVDDPSEVDAPELRTEVCWPVS